MISIDHNITVHAHQILAALLCERFIKEESIAINQYLYY